MGTRLIPQLRRFRWRTTYGFVLAVVALMAAAMVYLTVQVQAVERAEFEQRLVRQAQSAAADPRLLQQWLAGPEALAGELADLARLLAAQVTALTPDGETLARSDSDLSLADLSLPENLARAPEVRAALAGSTGQSTRPVEDGAPPAFFVAVPVGEGDALLGVLHFVFPRASLEATLDRLQNVILAVVSLVTLALAVSIIVFSEWHGRDLRRMTHVVERIAAGDLDARILLLTRGELGALAKAFNRMADKLQTQIKKRAREKDRLNTVMHVMTDGVLILNRAGEVKLINPAAARILATSPERAMHRSFMQAARDHRIAEVWARCQQSGQEEVAAIELSPTRFIRVVVTPFLKRAGRGYLVMLQDLTQVRRLQTIRQDFISNISHELRTPLASLRALVETLRDSALDDPPAASRFLDRMEVEVDALTQMVEELLELSRIESGQAPLRFNPTSPHAVIAPAVDRLRPQAERKELTITLEVPHDLPLVLVDAGRIHQVVTNLVHNAIKFTPAGGAVTVRATAEPDQVTVMVEDTGVGISARDLPRIFERFFKADRARAVGGTGLGLAIAKHVIQAHGGAIWAESSEGRGSRFYFTLPLADAPRSPAERPEADHGQAPPTPPLTIP